MGNGRVVAAGVVATVIASASLGWPQARRPTIVNPEPAIQNAVSANATAIDGLLRRALDTSGATRDRVSAVNDLAGLYFDHLLANGEALARDQNADVAHVAVLHIAGQIAMLPSGHSASHSPDSGTLAEYSAYQTHLVQESLRILRLALDHSSETVRNEAASVLCSRGDVQGLARIQMQIDAGRLPAKDGIAYFSLAPLDLAGPYIAPFLSSQDNSAKAAAVGPLSYDPKYTAPIRAMALDAATNSAVLRAALPGLAVTDKDFSSYGLPLAQNKALSRETREVALESTVKFTMKANLSEAVVRTIAPLLSETAIEINSAKALGAVRDLKSAYRIQ